MVPIVRIIKKKTYFKKRTEPFNILFHLKIYTFCTKYNIFLFFITIYIFLFFSLYILSNVLFIVYTKKSLFEFRSSNKVYINALQRIGEKKKHKIRLFERLLKKNNQTSLTEK